MKTTNPFPSPRLGQPALCLAPMEGVTDAPMRALQTESGAFAYCVSEFLRVSHDVPPAKIFFRHIPELSNGCRTASGIPVQIQLLGGDAQRMAMTARLAVSLGATAIDINFGCPAPTVNRHDGGATLLKYPTRIRDIVRAMRDVLPSEIPVSAKLRLGWDNIDAIHENAEMAALGGASWITIHGRTRLAGYAPPVFWKPIGEVRRRLEIPVIANGDIWTMDDFRRCREQSGCEHFMLGRGALADPHLPLNIASELGLSFRAPDSFTPGTHFGVSRGAWSSLFERFAAATGPHPFRSSLIARRCKQWVKMAGIRAPIDWFDEIKTTQTIEEMLSRLR